MSDTKETVYTVKVVSSREAKEAKVALTDAGLEIVVKRGTFVLADWYAHSKYPRMVSTLDSADGDDDKLFVWIWECSDDRVYRLKAKIGINRDYRFSITRATDNGLAEFVH